MTYKLMVHSDFIAVHQSTSAVVCFTDPFSLSLILTPAEPSLFPTTKHIISPATITREKRGLLTLDFDLVTHHTLTLCSQP